MRGWLKIIAVPILLAACAAQAQTQDCAKPPAQPVMQVPLPDHPFSAIPSRDGCTIFVSLMGQPSHLLVLSRSNGAVTVSHDITAAEGILTGMRLSPDGKLLAAANQVGITLFDTAKLIAGDANAEIGHLDDGIRAGSIYTVFSADGRLVLASDERSQGLTVHALGAGADKVLGRVPTGDAPVGLALSPDGKWLYSTSEGGIGGEPVCAPEAGNGPRHPAGRLMVIDMAKVASNPATAVAADAPAGCSPVRVALSADGARAYVTARGDDAVLVFDTRKLRAGAPALIAKRAVTTSPVGIAVAGGRIFVANSGRFGNQEQSISVLDQVDPAKPAWAIPAGKFPRELMVTPDGNTLLVTNFASNSLELVDLTRLGAGK